MADEKQRRAFISYSRTNKEFAAKLVKGLRAGGYSVWFDLLDIPTGSRWDDEVEKALHECSIFVIILTPASIASENVKDEIGYAIDHGKRILPILLEKCDVPLRLRRFQYVDFTAKSFEEGFVGAKELLGDLVGEASVPVPAKTPVLEVLNKTKLEPVEAKPISVMPVRKTAGASTDVPQKKSVFKELVIGIVAVAVLVMVGIGVSALSKSKNDIPPASNPVTQAPVATDTLLVATAPTATEVPFTPDPNEIIVDGLPGEWEDVTNCTPDGPSQGSAKWIDFKRVCYIIHNENIYLLMELYGEITQNDPETKLVGYGFVFSNEPKLQVSPAMQLLYTPDYGIELSSWDGSEKKILDSLEVKSAYSKNYIEISLPIQVIREYISKPYLLYYSMMNINEKCSNGFICSYNPGDPNYQFIPISLTP